HRRDDGEFDCLVPLSGGKDGSYVAYNLKHKYGMNPLCVTITPPLPLPLGEQNLRAFVESGYNHISINPDFDAMKALNKLGFVEMGFPYYGWLTAITTAPITAAINHGINLIFYGEDGEVEYGGSTETATNPIYDINYQKRVYLEGGYQKILDAANLKKEQLYFFEYPSAEKLEANWVQLTHWSYFENWDPYRNYLTAKEFCGLKENKDSNLSTFTNFSQNDQALYSLHTYIMFLKFGFGRANQDACIEIRRGAMDRDQAINLVKLYDGKYPEEFIDQYLEYYKMDLNEFNLIIDKFANKDLFEKINGYWNPKFNIK
ncbi:MAG: N-acetyl sugar amidotransferase, partial [Cytophagia bacterium]|nr:N-acetyl sugar amidotransferase [Cytophagia bacterium]